MIVVDTSALMALLLDEPEAEAIARVLEETIEIRASAATLAEARIVAARRGLGAELDDLVDGLAISIDAVTAHTARQVSEAYAVWGKGIHPAGLNFGDCFAYVLAQSLGAPLLFVGEDFARTDVMSALRITSR